MTDIYDRATEREEQMREDALSEARYQRDQERARPAAEFCYHCDDPIPLARRQAVPGVQLCVGCQQEFELHIVNGDCRG